MRKIIVFIFMLCSLLSVMIVTSKGVSASEDTEIEAFAHYEFNDETNLGKDSSKHGFHLKASSTSSNKDAMQYMVDDEDNDGYVSFRRDQTDDGVTKNSGAYLYAPQQGNLNSDFSDMITGSYTFSMKFKADNSIGFGDVYAVSFGRYISCFTVIPWNNGIQIQLNNINYSEGATVDEKYFVCAASAYFVSYSTLDWIDLSVVGDVDTNTVSVYINGELIHSETLAGVKLTSPEYDNYTFAVGAQCTIYGTGATQFANVDIKDIQIYDCALSAENVKNIVSGKKPTLENQSADSIYVVSIQEFDKTSLDLDITDVNSFDVLLAGGLPEKAKVMLSNGVERQYPVYWYVGEDQSIRGYVQCGFVNPSLAEVELKYKYVAKFEYDSELVTITDIKLDGNDYVPGTEITPSKHMISFKLNVKPGVVVNTVSYFGMDWMEEDDGTYFIDIVEGALICIDVEKEKFTVTYMDGTEKLSSSKYTEGGNEPLKEFTKDGYIFKGWYLDAAFSEEFTGLDYSNPRNITLYSKWESISSGNDTSQKSNDSWIIIVAAVGGTLLLAGAGFLIYIKRRKNK